MSSSGGWSVVSTARDGCGVVAHRGVLHAGDYVDIVRLARAVDEPLGSRLDELRTVSSSLPVSTRGSSSSASTAATSSSWRLSPASTER